jgi:hypothetical protein
VALPEEVATKQTGGNVPQAILLGVTAKIFGCRWERGDESACCRLAECGVLVEVEVESVVEVEEVGEMEEVEEVERKDVGDEVERVVE